MRPRIGVARVWQETNSFSGKPTRLEDFQRSDWLVGAQLGDAMAGRGDELGGIHGVLASAEVDIVPLFAASCWPGGPAEPELVEALLHAMDRSLSEAGRLDGVIISVHGAMASNAVPDIEGAVLEKVRARIGPDVPLVVSFDHHGNLTSQVIASVDGLTAYRHCPHVDMAETGARAARMLLDLVEGRDRPVIVWQKLPLVTPCEQFMTAEGPMAEWFTLARTLEQTPGIRDISLFPVQPWLDVPEFGWSVVVTADKQHEASARNILATLTMYAWSNRSRFFVQKWSARDAVEHARRAMRGPLVLADGADATNGGSPGDSTEILNELLASGFDKAAYLTIVDLEAVEAAKAVGVGNVGEFSLGARHSSAFHDPVAVSARVEALRPGRFSIRGHITADVDMGDMALLAVGPVRIVVSSFAGPGHDPQVYRHMGLAPEDAHLVVVKSTVGHLAAYSGFMAENLPVECRGPSPSNLQNLPYTRPDRPLYPLDPNMTWSAP